MRILNADERLEVPGDDASTERWLKDTERTIRWIKGVPGQVWAGIGGVGAVGLIVYLVFFFFLFTHPVKVSAESFSWERQVEIEQFSQVRTGQWYDYPSDAYDVSHSQRCTTTPRCMWVKSRAVRTAQGRSILMSRCTPRGMTTRLIVGSRGVGW